MVPIYKQKGETPLQALERFRVAKPEYASEKLSYAGRLDPMAEGLMLVLVGEENKEREKYLGLDKTYVTEILFGMSTDTGDVLGLTPPLPSPKGRVWYGKDALQKVLQDSVGKFSQKYPAYSSKSFGKDYKSVQEGKLSEEVHDVEIYSAELLEMGEITATDLLTQIKEDVNKVVGDFRQESILHKWQETLTPKTVFGDFVVAKVRLKVSSGFYVRQFAEDLGKSVGVPALALSILRTQAGDYTLDKMMKK